jgi:hypothetical protein
MELPLETLVTRAAASSVDGLPRAAAAAALRAAVAELRRRHLGRL